MTSMASTTTPVVIGGVDTHGRPITLWDGRVGAIRALRVARSSAVKAQSQATNQIKALIISGPPELGEQLRHRPTAKIVSICARLRPGHQLGDREQATKIALHRPARRHQQLSEEICDADLEITQLVADVAPDLPRVAVSDPRSPASA